MSFSPKKNTPRLRFLLDENVDVRLASFLKKLGFPVTLPPKGMSNGAIASLAKKEKCVLLTNDKDFANPDLFKPSNFFGIVVFSVHPPTLSKLKSGLKKLLKETPRAKFAGKTFLLSEEGMEIKE